MLHPQPIEPEDKEREAEQNEELEPLPADEFEKLSPEEQLLRAIFGQAPDDPGKRKPKQVPPPPLQTDPKLTAQAQPERVTMRFGIENQLLISDLRRRVVPTLEAVAHLDRALARALDEPQGDVVWIEQIHYGSPLDVQLAHVNPPTAAVLHALAQNQGLTFQDQERLKELELRWAQEELKGAQLRNEEQALQNAKLQLEIDTIRMQQLVTMFERLFPQMSEPMRLAIIAQNFPELRLLMPPNVQLLFGAEPSERAPSPDPS